MWIVPCDPFLMKKLLKSGICGSMNSARMHCSLWKSQYLQLLFNEQCMNSSHITPKRVKTKKKKNKKKEKKKRTKREDYTQTQQKLNPNRHIICTNSKEDLMATFTCSRDPQRTTWEPYPQKPIPRFNI